MTATLAELLDPQTVAELYAQLLGYYAAQGFPTQSWQPFGVDRTRTSAIATVLQSISAGYIPSISAGGLLSYAALLENPGWLQLLSENNFNLPVNEASFTVGNILLANTSTSPYTITAGQLIAVFGASGNRYINNSGGVLAASSTLELSFTAENAGASYNDPSSSGALSLSTPLPGVTPTNPAGDYTDVAHVGAGTGTLTLAGSPVGNHQVLISITSTGAAGVASWSYSIDGGAYVSAGTATTIASLGGYGISVTLTNGGSGTSFVIGDTYLFYTPGSWITTQGANTESPIALANRCRDRWSTLSNIATTGYYEILATTTPNVGAQVTQVIVLPDADINNKVNIVVAGPEGVLPSGTIADIQSFIDPRAIGTDFPTVLSPSELDITFAGTLTVTAAQLAAAQDAVDTSLNAYANGAGINGTLRVAQVIEYVMEPPGMIDASGITINGVAANLTLGSSTTFVVGRFSAANFTWVTSG
jgi:hypothetical protein